MRVGPAAVALLVLGAVLACAMSVHAAGPPAAGSPPQPSSAPPSVTAAPSNPETRRVSSTVSPDFKVSGSETSVLALVVRAVPAGATLRLVCTGETCPFKAKSMSVENAKPLVELGPWFNKKKLGPGTVIEVRITAPSMIGRVFVWRMQKGKLPTRTLRCLPPGKATPVACG